MTKTEFLLTIQYSIKQTSDENREQSQLEDYILIQCQILQTNITRTMWQTVRRITNEILGVRTGQEENIMRRTQLSFSLIKVLSF